MRVKTALLIISFAGIFSLCGSRVFAATYTVNPDGTGDYPTIQAAIDVTVDGDQVIVHPGRYNESCRVYENIIIRSINPDDVEIINSTILNGFIGNSYYSDVRYLSLEGLTLNGKVGCSNASPVIRNCIINAFNYPIQAPVQESAHAISIYGNRHMDDAALIQNCLVNVYGEISFYVSNPITVDNGKIEIVNSTIAYSDVTYNSQLKPVGGILIWQSDVSIKNSIIWGNRAINDVQIAIVNNSSDFSDPLNSRVDVSYSDVEGERENVLIFPDGSALVNYSRNGVLPDPNFIDPGTLTWGPGNMDADPLFVREPNDGGDEWIDIYDTPEVDESANNDHGDLHLKSEMGRFVWEGLAKADFNLDGQVDLVDFSYVANEWLMSSMGTSIILETDINRDSLVNMEDLLVFCGDYLQPRVFGAWVADDVTSPCIDAGDASDIGWQSELWPHGMRINMGAYGGTPQASLSLNTVGNPADLNHDDAVDLIDWSLWADNWMDERVLLDSDFDGSNIVDSNDLGIFLDNWLWAQ